MVETTPSGPRILPLEPEDWTPETTAALARWQPPMKFHKTMAHNPRTLANWIGFGEHILFDNLLPPREREIAILRIAARLACDYEWAAHRRLTLDQGWMREDEVDRVAFAIDPAEWTAHEAALIAAVDGIRDEGEIGDEAWRVLAESFTPAHFIDLIYLVGEFAMVATFMKSFRIEMEDGFAPIPRR